MDSQSRCVESYARLKNLKLVGAELGMAWQTVYVHLRRAGVAVVGDKARYGSDTDRLAAKAEAIFQELVPEAEDQNQKHFQSKVDFIVYGHMVDVKAARLARGSWAFSLAKQENAADFFVAFGFDNKGGDLLRSFIFPGDCVRFYQTVRVADGNKWDGYQVPTYEIAKFMREARSFQPLTNEAA